MAGSRNDGRIVNASFNRDGNLNVNWNLKADNHNPNLGGRSSVVSCKCLREIFRLVCSISLALFCDGAFPTA